MGQGPIVLALWRLAAAVGHGLYGVGLVLLRLPSMDPARRHDTIARWAAGLLRRLGLQLRVEGSFRPGAKLVVANHVSWLDIMAVHAGCPQARFVSKAEVRHWPLISRLVDAAGTLYLERERRRDAMRVVHQMAEALQQGHTVAVFPEGTTGRGPQLLPFHANLLQAAIATGTPVQPVVLRYSDAHSAFSEAAEFVGDTSLARSLWRLARGRGLTVHVTVLPAEASAHADRRALAQHLREQVDRVLAPHRGG